MTRLLSKRKENIKNKNSRTLPKKKKKKTRSYHGIYKQLIVFKNFIHQMIFVFLVFNIYKKFKKMQRQMPITTQLFALNPLNDAAQVDEIDYTADFDNLFFRMDDFYKFFKTGKISYNMLKYTRLSKTRLPRTVQLQR